MSPYESAPAGGASETLPRSEPILGLAAVARDYDDLARLVDGTFVVVVQVTGGRYRRRTFLTAASAQRAADNARRLGHAATVFLAELRPLWRVEGASSPGRSSQGRWSS